jgi:hypothetical protein
VTSKRAWELIYVLDSLDLQVPFDTEYLVFAGRRDPRVTNCVEFDPGATTLLDGFSDAAGRQRSVSALLLRTDAPAEYRREGAIRCLRNLYAVSSVIAAHQEQLISGNGRGFRAMYSSFFRFHPIQLHRDGTHVLTRTVAYGNIDLLETFKGQVSPHLPNTSLVDPRPDPLLDGRLLELWHKMITLPAAPNGVGLFRSLDVAFHAASLPETESLYEMGIRLGLWVSAFEILANVLYGRANLNNVLRLLSGIKWFSPDLQSNCVVVLGASRPLVAGVYADLYSARNDYVHGNPVGDDRAFTFKSRQLPLLLWMAPVVYKVALHGYLKQCGQEVDEALLLVRQPDWEEALLKAMPKVS